MKDEIVEGSGKVKKVFTTPGGEKLVQMQWSQYEIANYQDRRRLVRIFIENGFTVRIDWVTGKNKAGEAISKQFVCVGSEFVEEVPSEK